MERDTDLSHRNMNPDNSPLKGIDLPHRNANLDLETKLSEMTSQKEPRRRSLNPLAGIAVKNARLS